MSKEKNAPTVGQFLTVSPGVNCESFICGPCVIKAIIPKWHSDSGKSHVTPQSVGWLVTVEGEVCQKASPPNPGLLGVLATHVKSSFSSGCEAAASRGLWGRQRLLSKVRAGVRLRVTASWSPALLGLKEFLKLASVSSDSASDGGH